jgi:hypothetical protein
MTDQWGPPPQPSGQQQPGWGPPPEPQPPKPKRQFLVTKIAVGVAAGIALFLVGVIVLLGVLLSSGSDSATPTATTSLAVTTRPAPEATFLAQVKALEFGNKDLAGTPDDDLLALGRSVLDALDAAIAVDETTALQTVIQGIVDSDARPTAAQAKAFVEATITNLDPSSAYLLDEATTPVTTAAPKPKPKHWTTVISVSGSSDKRTPLFTLHGGRTKLTYKITDTSGMGAVIVGIYVLDEGTSLQADGGIPEVMATEPGSDSTELQQGPGRYYLDVSAANAHWTVTIQEYR